MKYKILEDMREMVGKKEPVLFFKSLVDVFEHIFDKLSDLEEKVNKIKTVDKDSSEKSELIAALSVKWDPQIAALLLAKEIEKLRENKSLFRQEISQFKEAYTQNIVTQDYDSFVRFWQDVIGEHPFAI